MNWGLKMNKLLTTLVLFGCSFFLWSQSVLAVIPKEERETHYDIQCNITIDANRHDYSQNKWAIPTENKCKDLLIGYYLANDGNFSISGAANDIVHYDGEQFLGETDFNRSVLVIVHLIEPKNPVQLTSIRQDFKKRYIENPPDHIVNEDFISVSEENNSSDSQRAIKNLKKESALQNPVSEKENLKNHVLKDPKNQNKYSNKMIIVFGGIAIILGALVIYLILKRKQRKEQKYW